MTAAHVEQKCVCAPAEWSLRNQPTRGEGRVAVESSSGIEDPFQTLRRVAPAAALVVRDYIKGLEAEAGSARSLAERAEADRKQTVERLQIENLELRAELRKLKEERERAGWGRRASRRSTDVPGQGL